MKFYPFLPLLLLLSFLNLILCQGWPAYLQDKKPPPKPILDDDDSSSVDRDRDGFTEDEGDCDDKDPDIYPHAEDICDYKDNDCDGDVDEDTRYNDPTEPNDMGEYLGILENRVYYIYALLHSEDDYDFFTFYVYDNSWSSNFYISATLSDIPDNTDYYLLLAMYYDETDEWYVFDKSDEPANSDEFIYYEESIYDQEGLYGLYIASNYGYDCMNKYTLMIDVGN